MQLLADRIIETQLLVVGGSGAGVTAAIQAHRQKKQVLLVCKGRWAAAATPSWRAAALASTATVPAILLARSGRQRVTPKHSILTIL